MLTVLRYDPTPAILSRCFFATGRSCLVHLIRKYSPGAVFLPNMVPEGLYRPFESEKTPIYYYGLAANLEPDLNELSDVMSRCNLSRPLVVVVHYFGYWMQTAEAALLAHKYGGLLLEDCAHCVPGNRLPNRCGDLALFSINKIVPMVGGAMLLSCSPEVDLSENNKAEMLQSEAVAAYQRHLAANRIIASTSKWSSIIEAARQSEQAYDAYYKIISNDMEPRKVRESYEIDFTEIEAARKIRVCALSALPARMRFRGDHPTFAFPIRCHKERSAVVADLAQEGILAAWLSENWISPPTEFWRKHLLLPIHEKIKITDIERMLKVLKK